MRFLRKVLAVLAGTGSFCGVFAGIYGIIRLDLLLNPWLKEVPYSRWSWLTTRHASTLSYINGTVGWIILAAIFGGAFAFLLTTYVVVKN